MKFRPVVFPFFLSVIAASVQAYADDVVELPETVITATKVPTPKTGLAALTTVITAEEIQKSPAQTLSTLLSMQAGVNVRSLDSSSNASIDMGGFGSTGSYNTLILVNGVSQVENDLSAPRISQISLDTIERIEIVRGSGAVQYGGGATGGVINIITKSALKSQPKLAVSVSGGSHHLQELSANFNVQSDTLGWTVNADQFDTNNYRKNNAEHRKTVQSVLSLKGSDSRLDLTVEKSNIDQRLPGSLSYSEWEADPRKTNNPTEWYAVDSQFQNLHYETGSDKFMMLVDASHREKDALFYQSSSLSRYAYQSNELTPRARINSELSNGSKNSLVVGVDIKSNKNLGKTSYSTTDGVQRQYGVYADNTLSLVDGTELKGGLRLQRVDSTLNSKEAVNNLNAWQFAVDKPLGSGLGVYAKVGKSFRVATSDEQNPDYTPDGNPLKPQTSKDYEFGTHWASDKSELKVSVFRNDVKNEIHYNPQASNNSSGTGANVNLAPTLHQGLVFGYKYQALPELALTANATLQSAKFKSDGAGSTQIAGKYIPLVPKKMLNLGLSWKVNANTTLDTNIHYVSKQYMDGDEKNTLAYKMPSYTLVNVAIGQKWKDWGWKFSVNNLFNKQYLAYASSYTTSTYVYSGQGRSAVLSLNYQFQ
ncbi:TonB-dependent receptor [Leeia sp. TBRC 13508]|uniref:TonB-dependent receptor n=1 Tax=Leeia speluncae TaxID=2884804 RepID=A0ABS8D2X8_9NEIS|nr:TonB-dependent receptor [Leeia speluncae]MCB6182564.1 TonB-dependent receptor [Leeia speluncae]